MREEINAAILAHSQWKTRLAQAIETGTSEFVPDKVKPDNLCMFGKWFHSLTGADTTNAYYAQVKDLHAKFHAIAAHVLELALAGKKEEAKAAMDSSSEYADISSQLILTLGRWKNESAD